MSEPDPVRRALLHEVVQFRVAIDTAITLIACELPRTARDYLVKVVRSDPTDARQDMRAEENEEKEIDT